MNQDVWEWLKEWMMIKFLIVIFISTVVFAAASKKSETWELKKSVGPHQASQISFYNLKQRKTISVYEAENPLQLILGWTIIKIKNKEYFLSIWSHGAGGKVMRIFDPSLSNGPLVYEQNTTTSFDYTVGEDSVLVNFYLDECPTTKKDPCEEIFKP